MLPEQERAIDALIVAGKLDAAADLYRTTTGTALIGAKMYVYERADALRARGAATPAALSAPVARAVVRPAVARPAAAAAAGKTQRRGGCGGLVTFVVIAIGLFNLGKHAIETRGFGMFTIVHAPYYRGLVNAIESRPVFEARLGEPVRVSDKDVWCTSVSSSDDGNATSVCTLPVSGSRTPASDGAYVEARTAADARFVTSSLVLHVRNVEYRASYSHRT